MAVKKQSNHGGLKFLAVLLVIGGIVTGLYMSRRTEMVQRVLGHREDHRLDHATLRPRFEYASAEMHLSIAHFYNYQGTPVDLTTTENLTVDRRSQRAKSEIKFERTATQVEPGVTAIPYDALNANYTEILTTTDRFESPTDDSGVWQRYDNHPGYYGTPLDEHYIPMIDDLIGFALRDEKLVDAPTPAAPSGLRSSIARTVKPAVGDNSEPTSVVTSYAYHLDLPTFRRNMPILAWRTNLRGPDETVVTVTVGFDAVGLLRYADVSVSPSVASTLVELLGDDSSVTYHYTLSVDQISGEPAIIDLPTNVVPGT
jgi:hypothetical protein